MSLQFWNAQKIVNTTTGYGQGVSHTTQLTDGSIVVTWLSIDSFGLEDIRFQRYDAPGNTLGTEGIAVANNGAIYNVP